MSPLIDLQLNKILYIITCIHTKEQHCQCYGCKCNVDATRVETRMLILASRRVNVSSCLFICFVLIVNRYVSVCKLLLQQATSSSRMI